MESGRDEPTDHNGGINDEADKFWARIMRMMITRMRQRAENREESWT